MRMKDRLAVRGDERRRTQSAILPVRRTPISLARRLHQICTAAVAGSLVGEELTPLELGVLAYLNRVTGEPDIDQNGLAARLGVDRSHASLLVEKLVSRRLVERRINGENRRAVLLRLTPAGEKLYARIRPHAFGAQQRIFKVLSAPERDSLIDLLVRVVEGNRDLARPGAGRRKRRSSSSSSN
jgi:DNA-binding MarR family transcriptional regulator